GADQVAGQQVGRELDAVEAAVEASGDGLGQQGLADAGNVLDEQVAFCQKRDEGQVDDFGLAEQDGGEVGAQSVEKSCRLPFRVGGAVKKLVVGGLAASSFRDALSWHATSLRSLLLPGRPSLMCKTHVPFTARSL